MELRLLVLLVLAFLFVAGVNCGSNEDEDVVNDRRLTLNAILISNLERHFEGLKVKLKKARIATRSYATLMTDIKYRLKKLEGTVCARNEFECGTDKYQCVSEILACDGVKDCTNGRDEDPQFCDTSGFTASMVYSCWTPISSCIHGGPRQSVFFTNYVISVKRSKIFPPLLRIVEKGEGEIFGRNVTMVADDGYLMLGTRRTVSFSKGQGGSHCQFVEDSFDRMYCDSYTRGSHTPCMKNVPVNRYYPNE